MHRIWVSACLVLLAAACGGGSLTLSEYATQGGAVVVVMDERIATLDAEWDAQPPTVERDRTYWEGRLAANAAALEGLQALDPPSEISELHARGMTLFSRLVAAEEALAVHVASFETATEPDQWWSSEAGMAVGVVEEEIDELCQVFQAMYDATVERLALADVPWIPSEMQEAVQVDVGCQR